MSAADPAATEPKARLTVKPMLTLVDEAELARREHLRAPRDS